MKKSLTVIGMSLIFGSAIAQSMIPKLDQEGRRGDVAREAKQKAIQKFDQADENRDGKLSIDELQKNSAYLAGKFTDKDKDKDGFLNWEEYVGHGRWPR